MLSPVLGKRCAGLRDGKDKSILVSENNYNSCFSYVRESSIESTSRRALCTSHPLDRPKSLRGPIVVPEFHCGSELSSLQFKFNSHTPVKLLAANTNTIGILKLVATLDSEPWMALYVLRRTSSVSRVPPCSVSLEDRVMV